jgi:hypothetical protein
MMVMAMTMFAAVMSASHGLGRNRFGAISSSFRIACSLLNAARRGLSLSCRLLRLSRRRFSAGSSLVSAIGGIHSALCWVGLARRATCRKGKG